SHIRLWCPRPFGTYSQNKARSPGSGGNSGGASGAGSPSVCKAELSQGSQMQDGRVLLDTWYVIKPGNTKEKIAFFVAHQLSGAGQPRPSAMKVKGNWATDCSKAKRRRRCSSYDPPTRSQAPTPDTSIRPPSPDELPLGVNETDLLSVAEMVALVEQRTAMALQGIVAVHSNQHHHQSLTTTHSTVSDPSPMLFESNGSDSQAASESQKPSSPIQTDQEFEEEQESYRVAQAIAHFESQTLENRLHLGSGSGVPSNNQNGDGELRRGDTVTPPPPPNHTHGEVRIAFRVSNMDPRSQLEPAGRSRCMFMSCGGGSNQAAARAKEKITCDLYQLVSPSSRDPSSLLLAATASTPKPDGDLHQDNPSCGTPDPNQELSTEVVVTGAVDQCVFYGKDSTENVQEETVCFAMPTAGGGGGGVGSSTDPSSDDPPPGQLFFLQSPRGPEDDITAKTSGSGAGMCSLDCANNNSPGTGVTVGSVERATRPDSPGVREDCSDPSLCRLYRHVSHDFLEIRFQIQRLLEPRQYMLLLPDHIMVNIFSYLPTRSLAALKCTCHYFKALIETYGVHAVDSRWNQDPLYRDDPCKQCKRQYERGDVSLCRWHPKPYHHDLPYGRSYWMCCRRTDKDTPGCRVGLHDNNWVQQPADGSQPIRTKREERREEAR
uniref:F-box protein 46 n=1 Tax=Poecilia formosa TaxID=48698 RepID=A0A087XVM4_POEFO